MKLSNDKIPNGIKPIEAYKKIRSWYQNNLSKLDGTTSSGQRSIRLIQNLPSADVIQPVEIKAVFREVISGKLEWAYHQSDGEYKMSAYAKAALKTIGEDYSLSENESAELKKSTLWDFITQTK